MNSSAASFGTTSNDNLNVADSKIGASGKEIRELKVSQAVGFLSHPSVLPSSESEKREFLIKKGLTEREIRAAFDSVRQPLSRSYPGTLGGWRDSTEVNRGKHYLNKKSALELLAETVLLPVTVTIGVIGAVNFLWNRFSKPFIAPSSLLFPSEDQEQSSPNDSLLATFPNDEQGHPVMSSTIPTVGISPSSPICRLEKQPVQSKLEMPSLEEAISHLMDEVKNLRAEIRRTEKETAILLRNQRDEIDDLNELIQSLIVQHKTTNILFSDHREESRSSSSRITVEEQLKPQITNDDIKECDQEFINASINALISTRPNREEQIHLLSMIHVVIKRIIENFEQEKYRKINLTSPRFKETIGDSIHDFIKLIEIIGIREKSTTFIEIEHNSRARIILEYLRNILNQRLSSPSGAEDYGGVSSSESEDQSFPKGDNLKLIAEGKTEGLCERPIHKEFLIVDCIQSADSIENQSLIDGLVSEADRDSKPWHSSVMTQLSERSRRTGEGSIVEFATTHGGETEVGQERNNETGQTEDSESNVRLENLIQD